MIFERRNALERLTRGRMYICARAAYCINDPLCMARWGMKKGHSPALMSVYINIFVCLHMCTGRGGR